MTAGSAGGGGGGGWEVDGWGGCKVDGGSTSTRVSSRTRFCMPSTLPHPKVCDLSHKPRQIEECVTYVFSLRWP